jgi:HTH-type transcriptional regulator, sugar sensing transcriptional regulator
MFSHNKMNIQEKLQAAGLTGNESKVYLELIKKGELSANQIARNLGIDRTLSYNILNHLIEKGHVSYIIKENKKLFSTAEPQSLLNPIKSKETMILDLIGELGKIKKESSQEVEIKVFEGKEGIRTLFRTFLKSASSFDSFGATGRAYEALYEAPVIAKEFTKNNVIGRIIMSKGYKGHEFTKIKNLKIKYSDVSAEASTTIFGDYVSIHMIKQKPIIILIKNKDIAQSYRNYFEFMWKLARK